MGEELRYVIMVREWDPHADGDGAWMWKLFTDSKLSPEGLAVVKDGLDAAGKTYSVGVAW